jgi:cellulose synthase/poly-beta-1,6-N-acetylglucosamine synthase-like glycosyltransferase
MRLARFGWRGVMIAAPTWEEAPVHFGDWTKQRTRWLKGHLQTWLVLMRHPLRAINGMGLLNFASVHLTLGGSLMTAMLHAPIIVWLSLGLVTPLVALEGWHATLFGAGYGGVLAAAIATRNRLPVTALLTLPFYWPLLSWAMARAFWEMQARPHYWAKTPHGEQVRRGRKR